MSVRGNRTALYAMLCIAILSGALCVWSMERALRIDELPGRGTPGEALEVPRILRPRSEPAAALVMALESAPFHPERQRPLGRFRLPGDPAPEPVFPVEAAPVVVPAHVQLIGTVVAPGGRSFAMCQMGSEPPKLVRIGERIGDLTLRSVDQGRAVFISPGGARIAVHVNKIGI